MTLADELDAAGAEAQRLGDSALAIRFWLLALRAEELAQHPKAPVADYLRRVASWRPPRQPICQRVEPRRSSPVQITLNQCVIDALIVNGD